MDYLIKPVSPERFEKALKKAADLLELRRKVEAAQPPVAEYFFVFSDYQRIKIVVRDILYIEGMGDYVKIHLAAQKRPVLTLERLKNLAERLSAHGFVRVHRSFLVNSEKVEAKQKSQVCIAGVWLPVGSTYADFL